MRNFILLYLIIGLSSFPANSQELSKKEMIWDNYNSPQTIGTRLINELLSRQSFMLYKTDQCSAVHYAEACAGFGAIRLASFLNDSILLQKLAARYMKIIDSSIINTANHVDVNVYGILPLELYIHQKNERFFKQGIELADIQWIKPLPDGLTNQTRYWIDDVWMIGSLQIQAYRATGKEIYLERAVMEIEAYINKLQESNGLFYHGQKAHFFWGRGNGWVAAGLAELLTVLPKNNKHYPFIENGYKKMMTTLVKYQSNSGMWRQLVDKNESFEETSSTAMFGYAITIGVKKGILTDTIYIQSYQKAWLALAKHIDANGRMSDICIGTGQSDDISYYLNRPTSIGDLHGQAPVLWFAYSLLNSYN